MKTGTYGKERRLRRRADFVRVQDGGQRVSTPHFILLVARRPAESPQAPPEREPGAGAVDPATAALPCARFGVVVTKKVGNAVQRNRIKRVCRECFRRFVALVPDGIDLVVIARSRAYELGLEDVRLEWERARSQLAKRAKAVLAAPSGGSKAGSK